MSQIKEFQLTKAFKVAVGDVVDRQKLDAAADEARANGTRVRIFSPGRMIGTCDFWPNRVNITLDANNKVTGLRMG